MDTGLKGATVLVTGAAGGIGWALAEAFAGEGANLVLHAGRREGELPERLAAADWSERAEWGCADLRNSDALDELVARGVARFGRLDHVVVNAGIWPAEAKALHEMEPARIEEVVQVNLLGAIWTVRTFVRALAEVGPRSDGQGASVCLIGSTAGRFGEATHLEYSVSKSAFYGLVRSLKNEIVEVDPYARVNMVEPGWTVTPMAEAALEKPGTIEGVLRTVPVRQLARPEDIARACVFFCSPTMSRHVSGEVLTVAGGMEGRVQWDTDDVDADAVRERLRS